MVFSRIVSAAGRQEIACTGDVWERLPAELAEVFDYQAPLLPRGSRKVIQLYGWIAPYKKASVLTEFVLHGIRDFAMWRARDSYRIAVTDPAGKEQHREVAGEEIFVGRSEAADLHVESRAVSRQHLCFHVVHRHLWVFDTDSSHGIYLRHPDNPTSELKVEHQARLTVGTLGRFADAQFSCLEG